jgi:hypothetical protein
MVLSVSGEPIIRKPLRRLYTLRARGYLKIRKRKQNINLLKGF